MKNITFRKTVAVMMSLSLMLYPLVGFPTSAFAAPPEGKGQGQENGQGNGNGNGNQGNHGNSDHAKTERGQSRADVVSRSAERAHSKQAGGKDFYSKRAGDYGQRELPIQASDTAINSFSKRSDATKGHEASLLRDQNRRIIEDFEKVIGKLREHKEHSKGKDNARWNSNPKDDRGQGNMGKVDMLDPYGHSKDDRMDLYGNRGRKIREEETPPIPPTMMYMDYLFVDGWTLYYWSQIMGVAAQTGNVQYPSLYDWSIFSNIYTPEEITYLQTLTLNQMLVGYQQGYLTIPATELALSSTTELDLSQIVNYADISGSGTALSYYAWGQPVQYDVSLTNFYDQPLTLTVSASVYDFIGVNSISTSTSTVVNGTTFHYPTLLDYQLRPAKGSDSVETWENITLQPGETLILNDTYDDYSGYYGVSHYFAATVTDTVTGQTYTDPYVGWFY